MITKNKLKKVLAILSVSMLIVIIISACERTNHYTLDGIHATVLELTGIDKEINPDYHYFIVEKLTDSDNPTKIRYDSLAIEISTSQEISLAKSLKSNSNMGIKAAQARDTDYEDIVDIIITSDKNYNAYFPAGSNLANAVRMRLGRSVTGWTIEEYLSYYPNIGVIHISLINFIQAPATEEVHNLTIKYITENGNEVTTTVEKLFIGN